MIDKIDGSDSEDGWRYSSADGRPRCSQNASTVSLSGILDAISHGHQATHKNQPSPRLSASPQHRYAHSKYCFRVL